MLKVKDGYAKLYGNSQTGNITQILLSNGNTISTSTFADKTHTHVWTEITDRPTVVSAFTNDAGYLKSHQILDHILSTDVRESIISPSTYPRGIYPIFQSNTANGLSDGGTYNGVINWRSYGAGTDLSGGYPIQIAYTAKGNLCTRMGISSTSWGNWRKLAYFDQIPTSIGDLTDNGVFVKKAGDTMTGSLILVSNAYNQFGTNVNIGSFAANTITTKASSGTTLRLRFLTETSAVGSLILESNNITTTNTLNVNNNLTITGDSPKLTFANSTATIGYLTMPSSSALYRNASSTAVKILDAANSYVNTSGYGYINNSQITKVTTATNASNLLGASGTDLNTFIKSTSTRVIYTTTSAKNNPTDSYYTTLHIGAAQDDSEVQLSVDTGTDNMYFRVGDNSAEWNNWQAVITNTNYINYIDSIKGKFIYDLNKPSYFGTDDIKLVYELFNLSATNKPNTNIAIPDNANSIITLYKTRHGVTSSYATQLAFGNSNTALYVRAATNGSWNSWATILTSANWYAAAPMYWANIRVSTTSTIATQPQFARIGLGTSVDSNYSLVANSSIKVNQAIIANSYVQSSTALIVGTNTSNNQLYAGASNDGSLTAVANTTTDTITDKWSGVFSFSANASMSNEIYDTGITAYSGYKLSYTVIPSNYDISVIANSGQLRILLNRNVGLIVGPDGSGVDYSAVSNISVTVTFTQSKNGVSYVDGNTPNYGFVRATGDGAYLGYNQNCYFIKNQYSYETTSKQYKMFADNVFQQPIYIATFRYSSVTERFACMCGLLSGTTIISSSGRNGKGTYYVNTTLKSTQFGYSKFIVSGVTSGANSNIRVDTTDSSGYIVFNIYTCQGSSLFDTSFNLHIQYLP